MKNRVFSTSRQGRISESCTPVRRRTSGFGVPPLGGAFCAVDSLASRLKAELQTRSLKAEPVFATFGDAPSRHAASKITPALARNSGFTLFELLVAMVTMAFLLLLLLNMVDVATRLWRTNEVRAEAYREARAAIGVISRDLRNLATTTNRAHFLWRSEALARLASTDGASTGSAVFFLSRLPPNAQDPASNRSEICQIGYFLAFRGTPASTNPSLNLYRYFRSSDPTFDALASGSGLFADTAAEADATELLARHVTGFSLQAFTATNGSLVDFTASDATPTPDLIGIEISAISQETAAKLAPEVTSWTNTNSRVIAPVVQTFTTHIRLPRPL